MTELIPGVTPEMLHPEFWISRCKDNQTYAATDANSRLDVNKRYRLVKDGKFPFVMPNKATRELFDQTGQVIDENRWVDILRASTVPVHTEQVVPGFAVYNADIRRFATSTQAFRKPDDREFDQFQETTVHTFDPVIVLGESADGDWLYVYTTTYRGFVSKDAIAVTTWEVFEQFQSATSFVVVTAEHTLTQPQPYNREVSRRLLEFGAVLPLALANLEHTVNEKSIGAGVAPRSTAVTATATVTLANGMGSLGRQIELGNTCVLLPVRSETGVLELHEAYVRSVDVHKGWLPLNRETCINLAFTLLHQRYGWGGRLGVHDCSSFIMDVYRMMGVRLPRDAGDQEEAIQDKVIFSQQDSPEYRCRVLSDSHPGDVLYMDGHTMMYLGMIDGRPYAIHDFAGYVHEGKEIPVNQVMVSTLDIYTSSGSSYLEALTSVGRVMVS